MHTISCQNNHYILEHLPAHMNNRSLFPNAFSNSSLSNQMARIQEVEQTLQLKKLQHRNFGHHIHSGSIVWNEYGRRFINSNDNCQGFLQHPVKFNCGTLAQCNCYAHMNCSRNNYTPRIASQPKYQKYNRNNSSTGNLICIQTQKLQNCQLIQSETVQTVKDSKESSRNTNGQQVDCIESQTSSSKQIDNTKSNALVETKNCNEEYRDHNKLNSCDQNENSETSKSVQKANNSFENKKNVKFGKGCISRYIENVDLLRSDCKSNHYNNEKTPMCLLNDLARYNKIQFQYRLTSENGPAHCKKFAVTLKLGDEEYKAEACKIKQAQHLAAKEAIEKTKYKHPVPKSIRRHQTSYSSDHVTPTVELNALTMKMGQQTLYIFDSQTEVTEMKSNINALIESNTNNGAFISKPINSIYNTRNLTAYNPNLIYMGNNFNEMGIVHRRQQRYNHPFVPKLPAHHQQYYNNIQPTPFLWNSPMHACLPALCKITLLVGNQKFIGIGKTLQKAKHDAAAQALQVIKAQLKQNSVKQHERNENEGETKSPISLVFEIANKRGMSVSFKVLREEGPAHMRRFTTACIVGSITAEAEGTGKKISKRKAAQKMLEELEKLPPVTPLTTQNENNADNTKIQVIEQDKAKNQKIRFSKGKGKRKFYLKNASNPIKELIEHHQNLNEAEPEFILISDIPSDSKSGKQRQFVIEARSKVHRAQGTGTSKRVAKLKAAKNLQIVMGLRPESNAAQSNNLDVKTTCSDQIKGDECSESITTSDKAEDPQEISNDAENVNVKDKSVTSPHIDNIRNSDSHLAKNNGEDKSISTTRSQPQMKDQLLYLANLLGFEVKFCDYPKGNHSEYLTIVMLSTTPPQICHGIGMNTEESQENAAKNSLKILSEMGINDT